jgi:nicotinamidase-related amidase/Ca2+-binding EF-hand superfamily protein
LEEAPAVVDLGGNKPDIIIPVEIRVEPADKEELRDSKEMEAEDVFKGAKPSFEILKKFDKDGDDRLNRDEFRELCGALFRNGSQPYPLESEETLDTMFKIFDSNQNGFICKDEFEICYSDWILKIVNPVSVLVIVDVQNDFISGSLALRNAPAGQEGKDVIGPINKMLETIPFKHVFYTKDWHLEDHISFIENVGKWPLHNSSKIQDPKEAKVLDTVVFVGAEGQPVEQRLWPAHCIQKSWGSELDPDMKVVPNSREVFKGLQLQVDSYSAFLDNDKKSMTPLKMYIEEVGALDVYVCGLAYDICVGATAVDSLNLGFRTVVVADASRGVDAQGIVEIKEKIRKMDGVIADTDQVNGMVQGGDRRPELGLHLAKKLHKEKMKAIKENEQPKAT